MQQGHYSSSKHTKEIERWRDCLALQRNPLSLPICLNILCRILVAFSVCTTPHLRGFWNVPAVRTRKSLPWTFVEMFFSSLRWARFSLVSNVFRLETTFKAHSVPDTTCVLRNTRLYDPFPIHSPHSKSSTLSSSGALCLSRQSPSSSTPASSSPASSSGRATESPAAASATSSSCCSSQGGAHDGDRSASSHDRSSSEASPKKSSNPASVGLHADSVSDAPRELGASV